MGLAPDRTIRNRDSESAEENGKGSESLIVTPDAGRHGWDIQEPVAWYAGLAGTSDEGGLANARKNDCIG